jgi:MFS family permease
MASGVGAVLYTGTADLRVVVLAAAYWGIVLGVMFPLVRTLIQLATPEHLVGRVMGTTNVSSQFGELFPLAFVPGLAAAFGIQPVLVGSGVALLVAALLAFPEGRRVDELRPVEPVTTEPFTTADERISPNP